MPINKTPAPTKKGQGKVRRIGGTLSLSTGGSPPCSGGAGGLIFSATTTDSTADSAPQSGHWLCFCGS
jgi:hypothetical protein